MAQHFVVVLVFCMTLKLGFDPRALCMLGKDSTPEVCPQPFPLFLEQSCYVGKPDLKFDFPTHSPE